MRFRLDWENLKELPRKKKEGSTKDDLAARKFNILKAKHKCRCHITNQKSRQIKCEKHKKSLTQASIKNADFLQFKSNVRRFCNGEIDEHP